MAENTPPPDRQKFWRDILILVLSTLLAYFAGGQFPPVKPPVIPPAPPLPPVEPPPQPLPKADPEGAILKLAGANWRCTAVSLGRVRKDDYWYVLTAGHCVPPLGQHVTVYWPNGQNASVEIVRVYKRGDAALARTRSITRAAFAEIATASPNRGDKVWHQGHGRDRPGNREDGVVIDPGGKEHQSKFRLSVSSGDSGAPIYHAASGQIVSLVCCTVDGQTWGVSVPQLHVLTSD